MREKSGLFLIEGPKAIAEAVQKRLQIEDVVVSESFWKQDPSVVSDLDVQSVAIVDDKIIKELATTTTPTGVIATAAIPRYEVNDLFGDLVVIADAVQDPGNLGTIFRTALAASASGVILTKGTVDPFNPKVVRAAMGALFAMPVVWDFTFADAIKLAKEHGLKVVGCEPTAQKTLFEADLTGPVAIALGNEGQGFTPTDLELVDEQIVIPMNLQSESLNVAICGAIVLFNVVQQRLQRK